MRKFFDKRIAQSSKGQIVALAISFVILVLLGGVVGHFVLEEDNPDSAKFGYRGTWGMMQCVDGGFVDASISTNTKLTKSQGAEGEVKIAENAPIWVVVVSLGFWLAGMILVSFFTGAATNFLEARREKIFAGDVDYAFVRRYILVVGVDFQVKNLVRELLEARKDCDVVVITDSSAETFLDGLLPELDGADPRRVFVMRKDLTLTRTYSRFVLAGAEQIYLIGDGDAVGRDGKILQALDRLAEKAASELKERVEPVRQVKMYLHVEDSVLYSQVRAMALSADACVSEKGRPFFDLEIYNYYESWAWKCWARPCEQEGEETYLPLRHVKGTRRSELFIIGAGRMGRAMTNFALPLMNYGEDCEKSRITIFDPDVLKEGLLPDRETLAALPEVEVVFRNINGCADEANELIFAAAERADTSVTVVIALADPGASLRSCSELSNRLRRKNISILVWQATRSSNCPNKKYLLLGGEGSQADHSSVHYFGMTDVLPWTDPRRFEYGMAVNYFYSCWYPWDRTPPVSLPVHDAGFVSMARGMWNAADPASSNWQGVVAGDLWGQTKRWKKWSSVNSGDTLREKSVLLADRPYEQVARQLLKAEHNRWWTERLLTGWRLDAGVGVADESHADKSRMLHGDLIPFEQLSEGVKDKDKVCIAAMAAYGFI